MRSTGFGEGAQHWFSGSMIPFSFKRTEQQRLGNPMLSVLERNLDKAE
jgi:hypothetical protein